MYFLLAKECDNLDLPSVTNAGLVVRIAWVKPNEHDLKSRTVKFLPIHRIHIFFPKKRQELQYLVLLLWWRSVNQLRGEGIENREAADIRVRLDSP